MRKIKAKINDMYLDYFNNFLSIYRFAEYYEIDEEKAYRIIDIGRKINHSSPFFTN